jgi:nucleoside-triphosphatase THEP1
MVTIVTGGLHRGKTKQLKALIAQSNDQNRIVHGFITEAVIEEGQRLGYDLVFVPEGTRIPFMRLAEPSFDREPVAYRLGKYVFFENAFIRAEEKIRTSLSDGKIIVMEELGFLEMKKKGFYNMVRSVLDFPADLITAVRTSSLEAVLDVFDIDDFKIIEVT